MVPLNPNDKVRIRNLNMYGTVLRMRPGDVREPEEEKCYEIQIARYFRRTDLELYDPEAEKAKREKSLQEKTARLEAARNNVERAIATGGDVKTATAIELLHAADELWKEFGHESVLKPIKG
jgi:hypothetical protein